MELERLGRVRIRESVGRVPVEKRESGKRPGREQGDWEGAELRRCAVVTTTFSPAFLGIL